MGAGTWESKKAYQATQNYAMAPNDILRSYKWNDWSVQEIEILFTTLLSVIQSLTLQNKYFLP